ncbi:hypothetical protein HIR71_06205 [Cellulomonas fimi]|uniref:Uncharacterized protein n=1 Tax=Cellulomonas fimi TaxID=1708 RepID=A0A7Y0QI27_CELFI|nr:hypothetical protein [Cellulomonas fimi]
MPEPATVGGGTGGGQGPGGLGHGADDLVNPGGVTPGTPDTDGVDIPPRAPGTADEPPLGDGPSVGEPDGEPGRVAIDADGQPHLINTRDDLIAQQPNFEDALARELDEREVTVEAFTKLVRTPLHQLDPGDIDLLLDVRHAMPAVLADDVLQKLLQPEDARAILGDELFLELGGQALVDFLEGSKGNVSRTLDGFVARAADVMGLDTTSLFDKLVLGYSPSTFRAGDPMFGIRFRAGDAGDAFSSLAVPDDVLKALRELPLEIRHLDEGVRSDAIRSWFTDSHPDLAQWADRALDETNLFRGNGFGGSKADFAPEFRFESIFRMPEGAELWRIGPEGDQQLAAVFHAREWRLVAEQPGVAP